MAGLLLGHLVELVLAICVAHPNANTGAHARNSRSRHGCACPRGLERFSTSLRECAPSALNGTRADTLRGMRPRPCGATPCQGCVCMCRGALGRTEQQEPAEGAQDGAVRQLADGVFYARIPQLRHLPFPRLTPQLQSSMRFCTQGRCQALVCRCRPGGVHMSSLRRGQA